MFNQNSIRVIENSKFNNEFIKPLYQSYCFSNLNNLIEYSLGTTNQLDFPKDIFGNFNKKFNKIILFFIDGFGWYFFEKFINHPFLKFIQNNGVINKITSQFPSTTSVHVTKIHTGLNVGESGIYEWNYYEPKVDAIISPLIFSHSGDKKIDTLKDKIDPKKIYPKKTFYQKLKKQNIESFIFQYKDYTPSTYSNIVFKGATFIFPYKTLIEAVTHLFNLINNIKEKSYFVFYYDLIDSISHQYGPKSIFTENQILSFLIEMEKIFLPQFLKLKNTLFLLTADHGHIEINPQNTFYLNKKSKKIIPWLKRNKKNQFLVPAGSPRDMFLYIKDEYLFEAKFYLEEKLKGLAEVYLVKDLIEQKFFGTKISKRFKERVGNLVILPYKGQSVWWYEKGKFEQRFFGHHGGLTKEEMEIPLILLSQN